MRTASLALVLSLIPAVAAADRVPPPPADCPEGSRGRTSHSGLWCAPTTCATDADCRPDAPRCAEASLCVEIETYTPGGRVPDRSPQQRPVARGACLDGACPGEAECQTARRCVAAAGAAETEAEAETETAPAEAQPEESAVEEPAESEADGGGGCSVGRGSGSGGLWVLLCLVVVWRRGEG